MLCQAAEFLYYPHLFELQEWTKEQYEQDLRLRELTDSMLKLESVALTSGAKTGFWRRLKKAAVQLDLSDKAEEYEQQFHKALSKQSE